MTIEEAIKFNDSQCDGTLVAKQEDFFNDIDAENLSDFICAIGALTAREGFSLLKRLQLRILAWQAIKLLKRQGFIRHFWGKGTLEDPYYVETRFGSGEMMDLHCLYKGKKYTNDFKKCHYFSNSFYFLDAISEDEDDIDFDAWMVSGAAAIDNKAFIYCGVKFRNRAGEFFIDFDRGIIMDYNLFCEVFRFEPKSCVNLKTLKKDKVFDYSTINGKNLYLLSMAYDEMIGKIKSGEVKLDVPYEAPINK